MKPYSYRNDPAVPDFEDQDLIVVFDGVCHFCSRSMRLIYEREKQPVFFIPTQSKLGSALLTHYDLDPLDPTSIIFLENGSATFASTAVFKVLNHMKGWPSLVRIFWIVPRPITDFVYRILARNRYTWFGKSDICILPTKDMRSRLLDFPYETNGELE